MWFNYGGCIGPLAAIDYEPRQARKGAAVVIDSSAEVWLLQPPPNLVIFNMSYLALARKWRPKTFSQLIGQEHITTPLINSLNQNRLHHAYLFTGTRGVGKTSVARILAKTLNCDEGINANPCLKCDACLAIEQGRFIDLIEIDGASKTKVEDTRELLDNVQYAPTSGRFKIYLIDEVHMLSQHSFNALLKTLEEPPEHVKFILATTDPQKVPVTVLSRCLQFNLKHLSEELIKQQLHFILAQEQQSADDDALAILAHAAQGSMRDGLSLLDQAITGSSGHLLASDVKTILGYTQHDYAIQLLEALAQHNATSLLTISEQILIEGGHFHYVLDTLLQYLHQICIYQHLGTNNPLITPSAELINLAALYSPEDVQLFYQIAIKGREELGLAPTVTIGFNMTLLRMLTFRPAATAPTPLLAIDNLKPIDRTVEQERASLPTQSRRAVQQEIIPNNTPPKIEHSLNTPSTTIAVSSQSEQWPDIVTQLKLTGLALNAVENAEFVRKEEKTIILNVRRGHLSLFTPGIVSKIEAGLSHYYHDTMKIELNTEEQIHASPAQQKEKASQEKQDKATQALQDDVVLQQIQKDFSAELIKNSITSLER